MRRRLASHTRPPHRVGHLPQLLAAEPREPERIELLAPHDAPVPAVPACVAAVACHVPGLDAPQASAGGAADGDDLLGDFGQNGLDRTAERNSIGVELDVFIRREDAERFIEEVRGDDPEVAGYLRIEERSARQPRSDERALTAASGQCPAERLVRGIDPPVEGRMLHPLSRSQRECRKPLSRASTAACYSERRLLPSSRLLF